MIITGRASPWESSPSMPVLLYRDLASKLPADTATGLEAGGKPLGLTTGEDRKGQAGSRRPHSKQAEDSALLTLASSLFPEPGKVGGGRSLPAL